MATQSNDTEIHKSQLLKWFEHLSVDDSIDVKDSSQWRIGTITKIGNSIQKNKKFLDIIYNGSTNLYDQRLLVSKKSINKTIALLHTKAAFHFYENYDKMPPCHGNVTELCHACNKTMCKECALTASPFQKELFICDKCFDILNQQEITKHLQNITIDALTMDKICCNWDKIIHIISDFAVGIILPCCNEFDQCTNEIYANNPIWLINIKHNYNYQKIHYYQPNARNSLKHCFKPYSTDKIRIFCPVCTNSKISTCCKCSAKDVNFTENENACYNHLCIFCKKYVANNQCLKCKTDFCSGNGSVCGYKSDKTCRKCIINDEKKDIERIITECNLFTNHIIRVICDYSFGLIFLCCSQHCNKYINFDTRFDFVNYKKYNCNGNNIHYYNRNDWNQDNMKKFKFINYSGSIMRIFCTSCTNETSRCVLCSYKDVLDSNRVCINHKYCHICNSAKYSAVKCDVCMKYCCSINKEGSICAKNKNDIINHQCKQCWINIEKEELEQSLFDSIKLMNNNIANVIIQYTIGAEILIECCNEECDEYIQFDSSFQYKENFRAYKYKHEYHIGYGDRWGDYDDYWCEFTKQLHWDMNGNKCYSYVIADINERDDGYKKTKRPYSEIIQYINKNKYKYHNYLGTDVRIFCCKCSTKVQKCDVHLCDNQDIKTPCLLHTVLRNLDLD
eukprot:323820_1